MTPYPDVVTNRGHVQVPARNGPGRTRPPTLDREKVHGYALKRGEPWGSPSRASMLERFAPQAGPAPTPSHSKLGGEATGADERAPGSCRFVVLNLRSKSFIREANSSADMPSVSGSAPSTPLIP